MPPTQDSQNTFKPSLTCIFVSARTRYIMSIPNGRPCMLPHLGFYENGNATSLKKLFQSTEAVLGVKYLKAYLFMPTVWI